MTSTQALSVRVGGGITCRQALGRVVPSPGKEAVAM